MFPLNRFIPHLALVTAMLTWSSSYLALKVALSGYSPFTVMAGRMLVASLVCLPLLRQVLWALKDKSIRKVLLFCVLCEPCFSFLCETFALRFTSSSQAGMVISILPLTVAAGAWLILRERLALRVWAGFGLAVLGVIWLTLGAVPTESSPRPLLGNTLELGTVLFSTGYTLCIRRLTDRMTPAQLTAAMSFAGAIFFMPLALLPISQVPVSLDVAVPAWMPLAAIVYLGSVVTFMGYGLYNFGICRLSAGRAAAYTNLIPVVTLFMGVAWLNDVLVPMQYAASALVVFGVMLSQGGGSSVAPRASCSSPAGASERDKKTGTLS